MRVFRGEGPEERGHPGRRGAGGGQTEGRGSRPASGGAPGEVPGGRRGPG